jgi:hypothetical protein
VLSKLAQRTWSVQLLMQGKQRGHEHSSSYSATSHDEKSSLPANAASRRSDGAKLGNKKPQGSETKGVSRLFASAPPQLPRAPNELLVIL